MSDLHPGRLKSGESVNDLWRQVNSLAAGAGFTARESVSNRSAQGRHPRQLRTPIGGSSGSWDYRGMWEAAPVSPYMTLSVVQFGTGTSSGMYLSVIDSNTNAPDSGFGWVQISSSSGTWL